jgi:hypothetical protein
LAGVVDYERVVTAIKEYVSRKPSHGQRDLLTAIARIEVESVKEEEREPVARLARAAEGNGQVIEDRQTSTERDREPAAMSAAGLTH